MGLRLLCLSAEKVKGQRQKKQFCLCVTFLLLYFWIQSLIPSSRSERSGRERSDAAANM